MENHDHDQEHSGPALSGSEAVDLQRLAEEAERPHGPRFWRSLHELAQTPEYLERQSRGEFAEGTVGAVDEVSRREFLKIGGAAAALAGVGLTGCTKQPLEQIIPYVKQPEEVIPGRPQFYATIMPWPGGSHPLLAESHLGRPTKIEGNPEHAASGGGTDLFPQSCLLDLYDPDRAESVTYIGETQTWSSFLGAVRPVLNAQRAMQGAGLRFLLETTNSPTLIAQIEELKKLYPAAGWHFYSPINQDNAAAGARMAFGKPVHTYYKLQNADVIVSLDADFLSPGFPGMARYTRDFAARRRPESGAMNRFYAIESTPTNTGAKADHRFAVRASEIPHIARALTSGSGAQPWIAAIAKDLSAHRGRCVVIAGPNQPPEVHALAHAMNAQLGAVGQTVFYTDPLEYDVTDQNDSLRELVRQLNGGKVDLLVICGESNPVYTAPVDLKFADALKKARVRVCHSLKFDETSELCQWHVPESHFLEAWGDARAYDGTVSIVQPLIAPLYQSKSRNEFLAAFTDKPDRQGYEIVKTYWNEQHKAADFEDQWRRWLHDGFIPNTALVPQTLTAGGQAAASAQPVQGIEVIFRPDPSVWDGRFANNPWLMELPKPMTKVVWDNPLMISVAMGKRMELQNGDMVELETQGYKMKLPVWLQPGHPDNSVTVYLGMGRTRAGRVGDGRGFNTYLVRTSSQPLVASGQIRKTSEKYRLASTQPHQNMTDFGGYHREMVQVATLAEYQKNPGFAKTESTSTPALSIYPDVPYTGRKWGMAIDVNACVGCNTCLIACQAENNIPTVGKDMVLMEREMHWIRLDAYHEGAAEDPKTYFQPVPCMQCENAPCEPVCPVGATVHSSEGLNDMVYNRCVGTRYCSNNCPYKVRRFNHLLYVDWETPQYKLQRNPDVTVRSRGVMEKCTYCVQRIAQARIVAEREGREVKDGEVVPACGQACPADAIVFGDLNDKNSRVRKFQAQQRNYSLLAELNTRPRTTYLAVVRNVNPEIEKAEAAEGTHA